MYFISAGSVGEAMTMEERLKFLIVIDRLTDCTFLVLNSAHHAH